MENENSMQNSPSVSQSEEQTSRISSAPSIQLKPAGVCPKCSAAVSAGQAFCTSCGTVLNRGAVQTSENRNTVQTRKPARQTNSLSAGKIIFSIFNILTGALSVFLGILISVMGSGTYVSSQSYGGDAYTGIQNAAAATARNVTNVSDILQAGFSSILIVFGLALAFSAALKLCEKNK